jgi:hypothetical protein
MHCIIKMNDICSFRKVILWFVGNWILIIKNAYIVWVGTKDERNISQLILVVNLVWKITVLLIVIIKSIHISYTELVFVFVYANLT